MLVVNKKLSINQLCSLDNYRELIFRIISVSQL